MCSKTTDLGDRMSAFSLCILFQAFIAFDQLMLFPKDRVLYLHESLSGLYSTGVYYCAKTIAESWSHALFGWLCAVITYEMFGLRDDAHARWVYYALVVLLTLTGAAFMTMTGALCKNMEMSNALGVTFVVLFMLFDGNWINLKNVPVYYRWLAQVSWLGDAV